ncbi:MAG TPA: ATP-binding protein, partial [Syntrophorhabdales bacterium]|nr:ATP-binding protein [Syntrophorhabdales bacterium]
MNTTDRKMLESQLAQAQKLEAIGQLAAGIAHEINTPIQYVGDNVTFLGDAFLDSLGLLGEYASLVSGARETPIDRPAIAGIEKRAQSIDLPYLEKEIPRAIEQSLEGIGKVAAIVRAMKEFSHPGTKEKSLVDINRAIENTITVSRNEWKYVSDMKTDFDPSLPPVPCLPGEFNQVILNIIVNAAQAMGDVFDGSGAKGTITITTRLIEDSAEIRIGDTGPGIPDSIISRIFDPFFTTKEVGKGTGQGLAIARSVVVDKHGGTIRCETGLGIGTTFIIGLPLDDNRKGD